MVDVGKYIQNAMHWGGDYKCNCLLFKINVAQCRISRCFGGTANQSYQPQWHSAVPMWIDRHAIPHVWCTVWKHISANFSAFVLGRGWEEKKELMFVLALHAGFLLSSMISLVSAEGTSYTPIQQTLVSHPVIPCSLPEVEFSKINCNKPAPLPAS